MSNGDLLIQPLEIDPSDFPPLPLQPGFTQLVSDELGNAATPTDGFDDVFAEVVAIVDALDSALGTLEGELLRAFVEADTVDARPVSATADHFAASLAPTDAAVNNLGTLLGAAAAPTPPSGGGDGGGGTGAGNTFDFVAVGPIGRSCTYDLTYTNNTNQTDTVQRFTLENDVPGTFALKWTLPVTLAVGESADVKVVVTATTPGKRTAKLSLYTAISPDPFVVMFTVTVYDYAVPCQGGPPPPGPGRPGGGGGRFK
jgi:hypothetical protein